MNISLLGLSGSGIKNGIKSGTETRIVSWLICWRVKKEERRTEKAKRIIGIKKEISSNAKRVGELWIRFAMNINQKQWLVINYKWTMYFFIPETELSQSQKSTLPNNKEMIWPWSPIWG